MKAIPRHGSSQQVVIVFFVLIAMALLTDGLRAQTKIVTPQQSDVTFTKQIAPILQQHCQECHRLNGVAPMPLVSYEEARPFAKLMKQKVASRTMPPWFIDPNVGITEFKNFGGLSNDDIATISKWADAGAPRGNPADMPPPVKFDDDNLKWRIGTPDVVAAMAKDFIMKANVPDTWWNASVDPGLKEDRYIKAMEVRPVKGRRVVHHSGTSLLYPDGSTASLQSKFANIFEDGSGRLMKAGSKVNIGLHLHAYREDTPVNLEVGLVFYPKGYVPKYVVTTELMGDDSNLDLPPNTDNIRYDSYKMLDKPTRIIGYAPHLHTRAKAQCLEAILPEKSEQRDGNKVEPLSCINNFDFNWMLEYQYATDAQPLLPAGTVLHLISWYNNTSSDRLNNDPDNWIGYGQRSIDDMAMAWMTFYNMPEEDFRQLVAERKEKLTEKKNDLSLQVKK